MRKVIYEALEKLQSESNGFPYYSWRWNRTFLDKKLQDIPFGSYEEMDKFTDQQLLELYTLICRQWCRQG